MAIEVITVGCAGDTTFYVIVDNLRVVDSCD